MSFIKFKNDLYTAEATTNYRIIHCLKKCLMKLVDQICRDTKLHEIRECQKQEEALEIVAYGAKAERQDVAWQR